jgi:MFS family permease
VSPEEPGVVAGIPTPDPFGFGPRFICALSLGSLLNPINSSIIAIALVPIGVAFHAGAAATAWLISGLYLATASHSPAMGKLADQWGARKIGGTCLTASALMLGMTVASPSLRAARNRADPEERPSKEI